jgi:hypothetical protein
MAPGHVYDKATYHDDTVEELGLPHEHAENHTVFFLRWLIEHSLMSEGFEREGADILQQFREGSVPIHEVYRWCDGCLMDDMLSADGNAFARFYFDVERGQYLTDYARVLQRGLPTQFHVEYTEANYRTLAPVVDERYATWRGNR